MKYCCVPGCSSRSKQRGKRTRFYNLPGVQKPPNKLNLKRRFAWLKAIRGLKLPPNVLQNVLVCSEHFQTGHPADEENTHEKDWTPNLKLPPAVLDNQGFRSKNIENIIENLPEVVVKYDVPEYIILERFQFNERKIEMDLVQKYIASPSCDGNGFYNNDHDYLGLPLLLSKTESPHLNYRRDHSYSISEQPACLYFDARHFCNICSQNNVNLFIFNKHMMSHTYKNDVKCKLCNQTFLTTTCLNNHLSTHTGLCDKCGNQVPSMQLQAHKFANLQQKNQNQEFLRYKVTTKKKIFFCVFCMLRFITEKEYRGHICAQKRVKVVKKLNII